MAIPVWNRAKTTEIACEIAQIGYHPGTRAEGPAKYLASQRAAVKEPKTNTDYGAGDGLYIKLFDIGTPCDAGFGAWRAYNNDLPRYVIAAGVDLAEFLYANQPPLGAGIGD